LSHQALRLRRAACAHRRPQPPPAGCRADDPRGGRPAHRPAHPQGVARQPHDSTAAARVQASRVPHAARRPGRDPHHAPRERVGLPLRPGDERGRRAHQQAAAEDRGRRRAAAAADGTQRRIYDQRRAAAGRGLRSGRRRVARHMARIIRSSAATVAIGYVLLALIALVLFAAPLRYAWQATIDDFRFELLQEDSQRLAHVFELRGPAGLASFIDERVAMQIAGERMLLFTDARGRRLSGNLPAWPGSIPTGAGSYTLPFILDGRPKKVAMVLTALPGGYRLLVGRDVDRFAPIERRFWYGLAAAVAVLSVAGLIGALLIRSALLARIHSTQQTVAAIMRGDLSHRLKVRSSGDELDTLAQTINRLLEQVEQLVHGIANVSNSIAHDLRTPLAELRSRLEELALTRP